MDASESILSPSCSTDEEALTEVLGAHEEGAEIDQSHPSEAHDEPSEEESVHRSLRALARSTDSKPVRS